MNRKSRLKPVRRAPRPKVAWNLRLYVAGETPRAIRSGEVDAIVVPGAAGDLVFTLKSADQPRGEEDVFRT